MAGAAPIKAPFERISGGLQRRQQNMDGRRGNDVKLHLDVLLAASGLQQRGGRIWMAGEATIKAPFGRTSGGLQRRQRNMDGRRGNDVKLHFCCDALKTRRRALKEERHCFKKFNLP
jgi:hypothetical protein